MAKSSICIFRQPRMHKFLKFLPQRKKENLLGFQTKKNSLLHVFPISLPSVSTRVSYQQCSVLSTTLIFSHLIYRFIWQTATFGSTYRRMDTPSAIECPNFISQIYQSCQCHSWLLLKQKLCPSYSTKEMPVTHCPNHSGQKLFPQKS